MSWLNRSAGGLCRRAARRSGGFGRWRCEDDGAGIVQAGGGHGHEARALASRLRLGCGDAQAERAAGQSWAERYEMAPLQVTEGFGLATLHAQQIGGAGPCRCQGRCGP